MHEARLAKTGRVVYGGGRTIVIAAPVASVVVVFTPRCVLAAALPRRLGSLFHGGLGCSLNWLRLRVCDAVSIGCFCNLLVGRLHGCRDSLVAIRASLGSHSLCCRSIVVRHALRTPGTGSAQRGVEQQSLPLQSPDLLKLSGNLLLQVRSACPALNDRTPRSPKRLHGVTIHRALILLIGG